MKVRTSDQTEMAINTAMIVSIVVFLSAAAFHLLMPPTSMARLRTAHQTDRNKVDQQLLEAGAKAKVQETRNHATLWTAAVESIGPSALSKVTMLANAHQAKLSSFRPQRTGDVDGVTIVPFLMTIDGSYPNVVAFIKDLEASDGKLAVSQAQMSSSDGVSDKVSASIGVVAYASSQGGAPRG